MQRFVPVAIVLLLGGCGHRSAGAPAFANAPTLDDADPIHRDVEGDRTLLVSESTVNPPGLYAELTQPQPDVSVTGGAALEPEPPTPLPQPLAGVTGEFIYKGGRKSVGKSIASVVDQMTAIARPIARKRLDAANKVPYAVTIHEDGDEVTVQIDNHTYVGKLGGGSRSVKGLDGTPSRMRYRLRNGALYQVFETDQGSRTNVFTARDDGGIDMSVRIHSDKLPADVHYRLSYKPE